MQNLSRRSFLHASAGLLALPALSAPEKNLTLGFSLYGMKTLKTGDALLRLSSIGFNSVEFCLNDGWDMCWAYI